MKNVIIASALIALSASAMADTTVNLCTLEGSKGAVVVLDKNNGNTRQFWAFRAAELNAGKLAPLFKSQPMARETSGNYSSKYEFTETGGIQNSTFSGEYVVYDGDYTRTMNHCMVAPSRYRVIIAANGKATPEAIAAADKQDAMEKQAKADAKAAQNLEGLGDAVAAASGEETAESHGSEYQERGDIARPEYKGANTFIGEAYNLEGKLVGKVTLERAANGEITATFPGFEKMTFKIMTDTEWGDGYYEEPRLSTDFYVAPGELFSVSHTKIVK